MTDENLLRARLHSAIDAVAPDAGAPQRVIDRLHGERAATRPRGLAHGPAGLLRRSAPLALTLVVVAALALTVLVGRHAGGDRSQAAAPGAPAIQGAAGAPTPSAGAAGRYVWLQALDINDKANPQTGTAAVRVLDWTGALHASFVLPRASGTALTGMPQRVRGVSPDGRAAVLSDGTLIDSAGAVLGHLPEGWVFPLADVRWSEDGRHLCGVFSDRGAAGTTLTGRIAVAVTDLSGSVRTVASIVDTTGAGENDVADRVQVLACDVTSSRIVVARYVQKVLTSLPASSSTTTSGSGAAVSRPGDRATVWVVDAGAATVLTTLDGLLVNSGRSMIASADGRWLVEFPPGVEPGAPPRVVSLVDGRQRPGLGVVDVAALTGDDSLAVVRDYSAPGTSNHDAVSLVDLATGRVLWRISGVSGAVVASEPGTGSVVVGVGGVQFGDVTASGHTYLVDGVGHWRELTVPAGMGVAGPIPLTLG